MTSTAAPNRSWLTVAKAVTALVGIALFGAGIRFDAPALRTAGIAVVAAAWLLRFAGPRSRRRGQSPDEIR